MRIIKNPKIEAIDVRRGKHCYMGYIENDLYKIFDIYPMHDLSEEVMEKYFHWGDYPSENKPYHGWSGLKEATIIQNICWYHELAPRVYEIVGLEINGKKYFAQRVEDLSQLPYKKTHDDAQLIYDKVIELGKIYGFHTEKKDVSNVDVMGDKLVDFNTLHFENDHLDKVKTIIYEKARYGKIYYQCEPKLDLNGGPRKIDQRIKDMKLDEIEFEGKTVLDLGCAGGAFVRYSKDRGANKALGIDFEDVIGSDTRLSAYLISWELGQFDVEFEAHDLREYKPKPADIVYFLSMAYHIGIPDWLGKVTNEVLIFEENSRGFKENPVVTKNTIEKLKTMFRKVELISYSHDREPQPILRCIK